MKTLSLSQLEARSVPSPSRSKPISEPPTTLAETRQALTDLAKRRLGSIPVEAVVDLVLRMTENGDWPVRKAAMEAVLRRHAFAKRDGVSVLKAPSRSGVGCYRVGRKGEAEKRGGRAYDTEILSLDPLRVSCDCPDFVRSSLGVCKHALVVLDTAKRWSPRRAAPSVENTPVLCWDARHPLMGSADRLARLSLRSNSELRLSGFRKGVPVPAQLEDPKKRAVFVERTLCAVKDYKLRTEPAVLKLLDEEGRRAREANESRARAKRCTASLSSLKRKLYPYQQVGVQRFLETGRLLLADDMGLGKTTQAIAACHALYHAGLLARGVLIVPAALKSQWKREWEATTDVPITEVDGSPQEREAFYRTASRGFLLMGYEQLLRDLVSVHRLAPDMVVLDEAQRIKNWATKSAASVKSLSPKYRLVLTGTPMENRLEELASLMDFVDDTALEPKWRLVPWHTMSLGSAARGIGGVRNLDTLRERMSRSFLRRVRQDVLSQLPKRSDTRVPVELTDAQLDEHDALSRPIASLVQRAARRPLTQAEFLKLMSLLTTQRMICNGLAQTNFENDWPRCAATARPSDHFLQSLFSPKLSALRGLIEQVAIGQGRKTVVFSQWRNMLRLSEWSVRDLLRDAGLRAAFFTGAETRKQRERALIDFHDDPELRVLFLSDAGGVGLNLQRAATCCINLELPWNPAVLEQRIGRIYRLGQTRPIDVFNLVSEQGIESRIAHLVANKKAVFSSLFDGTSDEVHFDGKTSFLDGVRKLVEPATLDLPAAPDVEEPDMDDDFPSEAEASVDGTSGDGATIDGASAANGSSNASPEPAGPLGVSVTRLSDGGLRIDASPSLAAPLAALLESLAKGLRASAE